MSIKQIEGTGDVRRHMLLVGADVSDGVAEEIMAIGHKVATAELSYEYDVETIDDLLGETNTQINKVTKTITFDTHKVSAGVKGKLAAKLAQYMINDDFNGLVNFKCVIVHKYYDPTAENYLAEQYDACAIIPQGFTGEAWLEMPITITFGGKKTIGYVAKFDPTTEPMVFTAGPIPAAG